MGRRERGGIRFIINKRETRHVYIFSTKASMLYLRCNLLPTPSIFFIPLLDLLVFPSPGTSTPLSPLDLIYLLFSHTPNLCQFQGPGTDPTGRTKIYFSLIVLYFSFCLRLAIDVYRNLHLQTWTLTSPSSGGFLVHGSDYEVCHLLGRGAVLIL